MPSAERRKPFLPCERLEAFSDGVFAIVITLLVLELALPQLANPRSASDLFRGLLSVRSHLASYVICFLFVGQLWISHTNFFRLVAKTDATLFWLNTLLLMMVCLQPFVTNILGEYPENPGSVVVFGILFIATGAVFSPMSWYCRHRRFFHPDVDPRGLKRGLKGAIVIQLSSLPLLGLAFLSPVLAMVGYAALIACYMWIGTQFRLGALEEA